MTGYMGRPFGYGRGLPRENGDVGDSRPRLPRSWRPGKKIGTETRLGTGNVDFLENVRFFGKLRPGSVDKRRCKEELHRTTERSRMGVREEG